MAIIWIGIKYIENLSAAADPIGTINTINIESIDINKYKILSSLYLSFLKT